MKATEFCYWLQGAFELGEQTSLTDPQVVCARKHLELVRANGMTGPERVVTFCGWVAGVFDLLEGSDATVRKRGISMLRSSLNDVFEHAIDKMYENSDHLESIHGRETGVRC